MFYQIMIIALGGLSIWLLTGKTAKARYWGAFFGLVSGPFWLITAAQHDQWGIVIMAVVFTVMYIRGMANNQESRPNIGNKIFSDDNLRPDIAADEARIKLENAQRHYDILVAKYEIWRKTPVGEATMKQLGAIMVKDE